MREPWATDRILPTALRSWIPKAMFFSVFRVFCGSNSGFSDETPCLSIQCKPNLGPVRACSRQSSAFTRSFVTTHCSLVCRTSPNLCPKNCVFFGPFFTCKIPLYLIMNHLPILHFLRHAVLGFCFLLSTFSSSQVAAFTPPRRVLRPIQTNSNQFKPYPPPCHADIPGHPTPRLGAPFTAIGSRGIAKAAPFS